MCDVEEAYDDDRTMDGLRRKGRRVDLGGAGGGGGVERGFCGESRDFVRSSPSAVHSYSMSLVTTPTNHVILPVLPRTNPPPPVPRLTLRSGGTFDDHASTPTRTILSTCHHEAPKKMVMGSSSIADTTYSVVLGGLCPGGFSGSSMVEGKKIGVRTSAGIRGPRAYRPSSLDGTLASWFF